MKRAHGLWFICVLVLALLQGCAQAIPPEAAAPENGQNQPDTGNRDPLDDRPKPDAEGEPDIVVVEDEPDAPVEEPRCESDAACGPGMLCLDAMCQPGDCHTDEHCASAGEVCQGNFCVAERRPEVVSFTAEPGEVLAGDPFVVSWETRFADGVRLTSTTEDTGPGEVEASGQLTLSASESMTLTLEVVNAAGSVSDTLDIRVLEALQIRTPGEGEDWEAVLREPWLGQLSAVGGERPFDWSVEGALPEGIEFHPDRATLSGIPREEGVFELAVRVEDAQGARASRSVVLRVQPGVVSITTVALPAATVGEPYEAALEAAGGELPYIWRVQSGALPPGLVLGTDGVLTGTPLSAAEASFTIVVRDSADPAHIALATFGLEVVRGDLVLQTDTLPEGEVGQTYSVPLEARGGQPPYSWEILGQLPQGIALNGGALVGIPRQLGDFELSLTLRDATDDTRNVSLSLRINPEPLNITTDALPSARVGLPYEAFAEAEGGSGDLRWQATGLPQGLTMAEDGTIGGTPTREGVASVRLSARDTEGGSAEVVLSLEVLGNVPRILTEALPGGRIRVPYTSALASDGGVGDHTWRALGPLPEGLLLSSAGVLSGTPETSGIFEVAVEVRDTLAQIDARTLALDIAPDPPRILTEALPEAPALGNYEVSLEADLGRAPLSWSLIQGVLPEGLSLSSEGVISGRATEVGNFVFTLVVEDALGGSDQAAFGLAVNPPEVAIVTDTLPGATLGRVYRASLEAQGGRAPWTWTQIGGGLPEGLSLSDEGELEGTPEVAGDFSVTIRVADALGGRDERTLTLRVIEAPPTRLHNAMLASDFIDISGLGERLSISGSDDAASGALGIGFPFVFYGQTHNTLFVSTNGLITLGSAHTDHRQRAAFPTGNAPNNLIAPYWSDLDPAAGGDIYMATLGRAPLRRTVIQWHQVPLFGDPSSRMSFEVILYETGHIQFIYGTSWNGTSPVQTTTGLGAAIGIENAAGTQGEHFALDQDGAVLPGQIWLLSPNGADDYEETRWRTLSGVFEDISGTGAVLGDVEGDDTFERIDLPFEFSFWGAARDRIHVTSNGFATFINWNRVQFENDRLPDSGLSSPNALIAPFWDDLETGPEGAVYVQTLGQAPWRRFVIQWHRVARRHDEGVRLTFQAVLHETSHVVSLHYGDMNQASSAVPFGASATVGIEDGAGQEAVLMSFDEGRIQQGDCVLFLPTRSDDTSGYRGVGLTNALRDISHVGHPSSAAGADDGTETVAIGFDFSFYDQSFDELTISANGFVTLGSSEGADAWVNASLPDGDAPNGVLAPLWDDLNPTADGGRGRIYTHTLGQAPERWFVVQWQSMPALAEPSRSLTFQVILREADNVAMFNYGALMAAPGDAPLGSATIGVESPDGLAGDTHGHNQRAPLAGGGQVLSVPWTRQ